ncbi:MAG: hypothetical protein ACXVJJ_01130 [Halobacteriota archaeon]
MVASFNEIPRDPVDVTCLFVRLLKYPLVMLTGTVVDGAEDIVAVILEIFESSQREVDILASPSFLSFGGPMIPRKAPSDSCNEAEWSGVSYRYP